MKHENRTKETQKFGNGCISSEGNNFINDYSTTDNLLHSGTGGKYDISTLKQSLDRNTVLAILVFIGYDIDRKSMFKLRPEERTGSTSVSRTGYIKDFGSDWGGDIFALLQEYHSLSFPEAVEYVSECLGGSK